MYSRPFGPTQPDDATNSEALSEDTRRSAKPSPGERWLPVALLSVAWWAPIALIGVGGDFPLSDDWAYARGVQSWVETGRMVRPEWAWAPAIPNILLGAAFWKVLGASFVSLRWSTLVAGYLGTLGAFALARRLRLSATRATVVALCLAWNPIYLNLGFTFMTDVLFAAIATWSLVLLARGWEEGRGRWLAAGLAMATLAVLSRNAGPAIPGALLLAVAVERIRTLRRLAWVAGLTLPVLAGAVALLVFHRDIHGALPQLGWVLHQRVITPAAPYHLAVSFLSTLPLLGAFIAPVLPLTLSRTGLGWKLAAAAIATVLAFLLAGRLGLSPPFGINVLWDLGVGARTLSGSELLPRAPLLTGTATAVGCMLGALALGQLASWLVAEWRSIGRAARLVFLFLVLYLGPLAFQSPFFGRWLLPVIPPLAALLLLRARAAPLSPRRLVGTGIAFAVLVSVGTAGTHDMMARHRIRWDLLTGLLSRGIETGKIDGGFEFNGYNKYDPELPGEIGPRGWVGDAFYKLSYASALEDYVVLDSRSYARWFPPGEETVFLHRRTLAEADSR